jgi:hypothetical protein
MHSRRQSRGRRAPIDFERSTTEEVLRVYERTIGPLAPQSRRRIVREARLRGWDRSWDDAMPVGV